MKKYIVLLILSLFIGCKKDLTGHWHVKPIIKTHFDYTFTFDISDKEKPFLIYSLMDNPITGNYLPKENSLFFPGDCGMFAFKYRLRNNKLLLESVLGEKFIAEKKIDCNLIDDFKTKLSINFLKLKNSTKDSVYNSLYLNEYINISFHKKDSTLTFETSTSNKLHSINTIDSLSYKIEPNYSEAEVPFINYILTPDKNIKANDFNKIIQKLNKNGKKKIYIRTLKHSFTTDQRDLFEHIRIREGKFDFNSGKTLEEIIN